MTKLWRVNEVIITSWLHFRTSGAKKRRGEMGSPPLTAVEGHACDGSGGVKEQFFVGAGQHGEQSGGQTGITETFTDDG